MDGWGAHARHEILARLGAWRGAGPAEREAARARVRARLDKPEAAPRPRVDGDLVARFEAAARAMGSTLARVDGWPAVPRAVADYLAGAGGPRAAVVWPSLAHLPWEAAGLRVGFGPADGTQAVGITGAFCALAESGTLMLCAGAATPTTVSLLPDTHIAVLPASRVVAGMEEAWVLARAEPGEPPGNVCFVSGPSRTGDIELTIVLGAHGPCRVHGVVVEGV